MLKKYSGIEIVYGILFFVVHIAIETISYMLLYLRFKTFVAVLIVLMYDFFAFVPQSLIGEWHNKHKKVDGKWIEIDEKEPVLNAYEVLKGCE